MAAALDFFYDLGSPYSYLASTQLEGLCARTGATARLVPITLGGVRKAMGRDLPPPAQLVYMSHDVGRWARLYGVPMQIPAVFPTKTIQALRVCVAADEEGRGAKAMHTLFAAYWAKGQDIGAAEVIRAALDEAGLPGAKLVARSEEQDVKDALRHNTDWALARGVFGVPTIFVGERSFWGNDRLAFVENALRAS